MDGFFTVAGTVHLIKVQSDFFSQNVCVKLIVLPVFCKDFFIQQMLKHFRSSLGKAFDQLMRGATSTIGGGFHAPQHIFESTQCFSHVLLFRAIWLDKMLVQGPHKIWCSNLQLCTLTNCRFCFAVGNEHSSVQKHHVRLVFKGSRRIIYHQFGSSQSNSF